MIRQLENTSPAFRAALSEMARRHDWDADAIAAVMAVETGGTFSPVIRNPSSNAVGLIQFMPNTAIALGTTDAKLAAMSAVEQLGWVERYLEQTLGTRRNLRRVDYYLAVWRPASIGAPMDSIISSAGQAAYEANKNAFDPERKGYITPRDLDDRLAVKYGDSFVKKKSTSQGEA